jgi:hypothetical protein
MWRKTMTKILFLLILTMSHESHTLFIRKNDRRKIICDTDNFALRSSEIINWVTQYFNIILQCRIKRHLSVFEFKLLRWWKMMSKMWCLITHHSSVCLNDFVLCVHVKLKIHKTQTRRMQTTFESNGNLLGIQYSSSNLQTQTNTNHKFNPFWLKLKLFQSFDTNILIW